MFRTMGTFGLVLLMVVVLVMVGLSILTFGINHPITWVLIAAVLVIPFIHNKVTANRYLTWKDEYSVGIEAMDNDHKKLLNLINQLQTASTYYTGKESEEKALAELIDYTKTHFKNEETLLEENEYADLVAHKEQHKQFIDKVNGLVEQYKKDPNATLVDALAFLKEWLIKHINGTDKEYGKILNEKGIH
ncbi:MAG: bacteriohemerythrin [gamma proteobacterium symbiont of Taylorina sp.]|nr:bacteriohemerythrin [gamma proteobacterium symbiont of Taylorina sp.]